MVEVSIGIEQRDLRDVTPSSLRSAVETLRHRPSAACIKVRIVAGPIDMILATPGCPSGEDGRPFRDEELKIFELWRIKHLDTDEFSVHDLEEFLTAMRKYQ